MNKSFIFDFDGVIAPTNIIKTKALSSCVYDILGKDAFLDFYDHHIKNGGISRYEKFKRIVSIYNKEESYYNKLIRLADIKVTEALNNIDYEDNLLDLLKSLKDKKYKIIIISGAPRIDLINMLNKWKIKDYFNNIYGSPISKMIHFKNYRNKNKLDKIICIGDSPYDKECAEQINAKFILYCKYSENKYFVSSYKGDMFDSFKSILQSNIIL